MCAINPAANRCSLNHGKAAPRTSYLPFTLLNGSTRHQRARCGLPWQLHIQKRCLPAHQGLQEGNRSSQRPCRIKFISGLKTGVSLCHQIPHCALGKDPRIFGQTGMSHACERLRRVHCDHNLAAEHIYLL